MIYCVDVCMHLCINYNVMCIVQCLEAHEILGWGVLEFDNRMEAMCSNMRTKHAKALKRKRKMERRSTGDSDDDSDSDTSTTPQKSKRKRTSKPNSDSEDEGDDGMATVRSWKVNDLATLICGEGNAIAHAQILDDEPDLSEHNAQNDEFTFEQSHWKEVNITAIIRGYSQFEIAKDQVYTSDGLAFDDHRKRRLHELQHLDSVVIWHDYLRPRMRSTKTKSKKSNKKMANRR